MTEGRLYRLSAFTATQQGGNPAGVWVGEQLPDPETMQAIAREVGYSETAFIAPSTGVERVARYFSPAMEVPFCGHATIATGVLLGEIEGDGRYLLSTASGMVPVVVRTREGRREASLTSVVPKHTAAPERFVTQTLAALHWSLTDLDPSIPVARAYAGAWHLILAVAHAERLATLEYDFLRLRAIMLADGLTTLQLIWRESRDMFHSRNPFPVGGVVEDPATGAAAAALGGYLRDAALVTPPVTITIRQGEAMGRPSFLVVEIPVTGGIVVTGTAVRI